MRINTDTLLLRMFQITLVFYVFMDLMNSTIVGNSQANRSLVYVAIAAMIVLCGLYVIPSILHYITKVELRIMLLAFWIILVNALNNDFSWISMVHMGLAILWLLLYSYYYRYPLEHPDSYKMAIKFLRALVYVYIVASIYASYVFRIVLQSGTGVLSTSYHVLIFLPIVLLSKNKAYRTLTVAVIIVTVILSFKRGAIIAMAAMLLAYVFTKGIQKKDAGLVFKLLVVSVVLFLLIWQLDKMVDGQILARFTRESLADGSGRSHIYSDAISIFNSRGILGKLFGTGGSTSQRLLGIAVHNEWLEFAIDYGLIGCFFYLSFISRIFRIAIHKMRAGDEKAPHVMCLFVFMLSVSMYGAIYFVQSTIFLFISLAILLLPNSNSSEDANG